MQYNVAQLLDEPVGVQWEFDLDQETAMESGAGERIKGKLRFTRTDKSIWVRGEINTEMEEVCARCLVGFPQSIHASISERFYPSGKQNVEDEELVIGINDILDLSEILRQYLILNRPVKALCRTGCLGICSICGNDKNKNDCRCTKKSIDPRWEKLASLRFGVEVGG